MGRPKLDFNPTREKILHAALKVFLEKGFAGTSMSMIAKEAQINQSLIYHHFQNKAELWKTIKEEFAHHNYPLGDLQVNASTNLHDFIAEAVQARFNFYLNNPEIIRMMNWQRLEMNQTELAGKNIGAYNTLIEGLTQLKSLGKIRQNIDLENISDFLCSAITAPLYDHLEQFRNDCEYKDRYLRTVIDYIVVGLSSATVKAPAS
jgi:AcrR family transcriptional regulator